MSGVRVASVVCLRVESEALGLFESEIAYSVLYILFLMLMTVEMSLCV